MFEAKVRMGQKEKIEKLEKAHTDKAQKERKKVSFQKFVAGKQGMQIC